MMMNMCVSLKHIVNSHDIRRVLVTPCGLPFNVRRDTMICMASYLSDCKSNHPKETSDIIDEMIASNEWMDMRNVAGRNDLMPKFILKTVFSHVFLLPEGRDVSRSMKTAWKEISSHMRTMDLIASLNPGTGSDHSVRDAHLELLTNTSKYANLTERDDDLDRIVKTMRSMRSEPIGSARERHGGERSVLMAVDLQKACMASPRSYRRPSCSH
jgi:hypothetical protein